MCGIAGIVHFATQDAVSPEAIRKMCQTMVHRGPDDAGTHVDGHVGLGHRRLAIIDRSGGHQPMQNEDGTVWISYNGEIYNYNEIRNDLRQSHRFASRSDTESIVHLYEEEGEDAWSGLNGIFAFAIWDKRTQELHLVRDRFGVKPLYYAVVDGSLIFASEVRAILSTGLVQARPDPLALSEHFTFHNTLEDRTLFEGIKLLQPGTSLTVSGGQIHIRRYYDIRSESGGGHNEKYYIDGLRDRFESAVSRQLVSDVPLGTYLSGGVDSGSITAVAAGQVRPLHTFTCGFDTSGVNEMERHFDERVQAELLAKLLDTQHHELHIFAGDMQRMLPEVVWHLEDFRVGISYQIYAISQLIADHVTVVLSGVGGDELFAGYPWRYQPVLDLPLGEAFDRSYYRSWVRLLDDTEKQSLFSDDLNRQTSGFSTFECFKHVLSENGSDNPLDRALYFDMKTFLHGLFVVEDKLSMAHSLETRVPFLDHDLVEFALSIPPELKLRDGETKYVFQKAMRGVLPQSFLSRRKQGFTPPAQTWYKRDTLTYIHDLILGDRSLDRGYFKPSVLCGLLDDHIEGRRNHRHLIWSLMCFEWWNRIFIDGDQIPESEPLAPQALALTA